MIIFVSIALAGCILVAGSFLFGSDQEIAHDGGDVSDAAHGDSPTVSIFSMKVLASLIMGFGAAGAIAVHYGAGYFTAALVAVGCGVALAALMYVLIRLIYNQQSSSLVSTRAAVGHTGSVIVSIGENSPGEVGLYLDGVYRTFSASSSDGKPVNKGESVLVLDNVGSHLVVERGP